MAKYTEIPFFGSDRRGRLGNLVFSHNKYGPFIREYKKPYNPKTEAQQEVRGRMAELGKLWSKLNSKQVEAWSEAPQKFGIMSKDKRGYLSGNAFFNKTNMNLMKVGCKPLTDCPESLHKLQYLSAINVFISSKHNHEDIELTYEPNLDEYNIIIISATDSVRRCSFPAEHKFKRIGVIDWRSNPGNIVTSLLQMYEDVYPTFDIKRESTIAFRLQVMEVKTGQARKPIYLMASSKL